MTSKNRELFYGPTDLEFSVLENAYFLFNTVLGMGYGTFSTGNVLIDKNAYVEIIQTKKNGSYPSWYTNGSFIMNDNSTLIMKNNYDSIATANYNIYFRTSLSSLTLNNPKKVVLYNSKANVFYSDNAINFTLNYSRINLWNNASDLTIAGSLDDMPNYSWYKDVGISTLSGVLSKNTTTLTSNNYTTEELSLLPDLSNFKLNNKVISIGTMPLKLNPVSDSTLILKGNTTPSSSVKITYLENNEIVTANDSGDFFLNLTNSLDIGTKINYVANLKNSFIYVSKTIEIVYEGELVLDSAPSIIKFNMKPFKTEPILCGRDNDISIVVTDSRINSSNWKLYALINHDLTSQNNYVLKDALVYFNNQAISVLSSTPTLVYTGENNSGELKVTTIKWNDDEEILLRISDEVVQLNEIYKAEITWILEE